MDQITQKDRLKKQKPYHIRRTSGLTWLSLKQFDVIYAILQLQIVENYLQNSIQVALFQKETFHCTTFKMYLHVVKMFRFTVFLDVLSLSLFTFMNDLHTKHCFIV